MLLLLVVVTTTLDMSLSLRATVVYVECKDRCINTHTYIYANTIVQRDIIYVCLYIF